jgi:type II secretory pathway pseudopilin PulG
VTARRLRAEAGFVLPGAIALLAIFAGLTATALTFSLQSLDNTNRDRRVVRALQAADAGADIAIFRLNHMLVAAGTGATLGLAVDAVGSLGCTSVDIAGFNTIVPPTAAAYCAAQSGSAADVQDATYSYRVATAVNVASGTESLLTRKILVTGTAYATRSARPSRPTRRRPTPAARAPISRCDAPRLVRRGAHRGCRRGGPVVTREATRRSRGACLGLGRAGVPAARARGGGRPTPPRVEPPARAGSPAAPARAPRACASPAG